MSKCISLVVMSLFLFGCANVPKKAPPTYPPSHYSDRGADYTHLSTYPKRQAHAGQWAVAAIGTPFYLVLKAAVCSASLVVAAPTAAIIALSDSPYGMGVDKLGDGLAANCGPPYVLSPS